MGYFELLVHLLLENHGGTLVTLVNYGHMGNMVNNLNMVNSALITSHLHGCTDRFTLLYSVQSMPASSPGAYLLTSSPLFPYSP